MMLLPLMQQRSFHACASCMYVHKPTSSCLFPTDHSQPHHTQYILPNGWWLETAQPSNSFRSIITGTRALSPATGQWACRVGVEFDPWAWPVQYGVAATNGLQVRALCQLVASEEMGKLISPVPGMDLLLYCISFLHSSN